MAAAVAWSWLLVRLLASSAPFAQVCYCAPFLARLSHRSVTVRLYPTPWLLGSRYREPLVGLLSHWLRLHGAPPPSQRPLMVPLSHWPALRWTPPPRPTVGERPLVYRSANGRWSSGPHVASEVRGGSGLRPGALQLTQRVPEGCVLMAPERGRAQALRRWSLSRIPTSATSWQQLSARDTVCRTSPRLLGGPRSLWPAGPGRPAPLVMTLCRVWGPGPEGAARGALLPLSHHWTSEGGSCAWEPGPFLSEQGITFVWLQEHC